LFHAEGKQFYEVISPGSESGASKRPIDGLTAARLVEMKGVGKEFEEFLDTHVLVEARNIGKIAGDGSHKSPGAHDIPAVDQRPS